jgi:hypothetical protein
MTKTFPETVKALYYIGNSIISCRTFDLLTEARRDFYFFIFMKTPGAFSAYESAEQTIIDYYGVK